MEKIGIAVIGAGAMGAKHADLIRRHEACSLALAAAVREPADTGRPAAPTAPPA